MRDSECDVCQKPWVPEVRDWTDESLVRGKRITLRALKVYRCACGVAPDFPRIVALLDAVNACGAPEQCWRFMPGPTGVRDGRWIQEPHLHKRASEVS